MMRLEHVDIDDDLAMLADAYWPDSTWSEVIDHALALLIEATGDDHDPQPSEVQADFADLPGVAQALSTAGLSWPTPTDLATGTATDSQPGSGQHRPQGAEESLTQ